MNIDNYLLTQEQYDKLIGHSENEYELNYKEYRSFAERAITGTFYGATPSKNPTSIMVVAPAGSGKTGLKVYAKNKFITTRSEVISEINPDLVRIYHKYYNVISEVCPERLFEVTQKAMQVLLDHTLKPYANDNKYNIITEGAFASKDAYMEILEAQRSKGYTIDIQTIVVNKLEQILSCIERQQDMIDRGMKPRICPISYIDKTYESFLDTLGEAERRCLCSNISVYRRGKEETSPTLIWQTGDQRHRTAIEAVKTERNDSLKQIINNREQYEKRIADLFERIQSSRESGVKSYQMEQLSILEERFEQQIEKQNNIGELE